MKIRVERDALSEALGWAARILPNRPPNPVIAGALLEADHEHLTLAGTDHAQSVRARLDAVVEEPGRALVSGRMFAEIARSLPNMPVTLEADGNRMTVTCGRASFTLREMQAEDYPELPGMPDVIGRVPGADFADAVGQVAGAAAREDSMPVLTGVRIEFTGEVVTLAATDRFRLAVRELPWHAADSGLSASAQIRAKVLADLARSLAAADFVDIGMDEQSSMVGFAGLGRTTVSRLLEGGFPAFRLLLPTESRTLVTVDTAVLADAVKRVKLVRDRPSTPVRLAFGSGEISLRAGGPEDAQASEGLECEISGDELEINFNPDYLLDGLSAVEAPLTRIAMNGPTKSAVITAGGDEADQSFRYLLMPVSLGR